MKKILVVEDDPYSAAAISVRLRHFGYETAIARNALQAFMAAVHDRPDLLLLDIGLPDKDGFHLAGDMRRFPVTADIPIIFVTGKKDPHLREKVMDLKAAGFSKSRMNPKCCCSWHNWQSISLTAHPTLLDPSGAAATAAAMSQSRTYEENYCPGCGRSPDCPRRPPSPSPNRARH